jgi:hypothetical protein
MVSLLIWVLIVILIFGAILYAVRSMTLDPQLKNIAFLVILILFIIVLLGVVGLIPGVPLRPIA